MPVGSPSTLLLVSRHFSSAHAIRRLPSLPMNPVVRGVVRSHRNLAPSPDSRLLLQPRRCFVFVSWHLPTSLAAPEPVSFRRFRSDSANGTTNGLRRPRRESSVFGRIKRTLGFSSPVCKTDIDLVRSCLGLSTTKGSLKLKRKDVIFLAIDTEGAPNLTEVGISTLDTRDIQDLDPGPAALYWCNQVQRQHFRLVRGVRHPFLFGLTTHVPRTALKPIFLNILDPKRKYVLVGHSLNGDVKNLTPILGHDLRRAPNIIAMMDTVDLVQHLRTFLPGRLRELWQRLVVNGSGNATPADVVNLLSPKLSNDTGSINNHAFHNAGNDAFYNMHTLLLLALNPDPQTATQVLDHQVASQHAPSFLGRVVDTVRSTFTQPSPQVNKSSVTLPPAGSLISRPKRVATIQPPQTASSRSITLRIKTSG